MSEERITVSNLKFEHKFSAWIAEDIVIGENVIVFPGAVLGRPPVSTRAQVRKVNGSLPPLKIGNNCVIGSNVVIYRGTIIQDNCLIGDNACIREQVIIGDSSIIAMGVTINYNTKIGSRVKVMDNTHLTGNMIIEDNVFIGPLVATANDNSMGREALHDIPLHLRNRQGPIFRKNVSIGEGACILPGIIIGENSIIGANSVVTKSVPSNVLVMGVPARVIRKI